MFPSRKHAGSLTKRRGLLDVTPIEFAKSQCFAPSMSETARFRTRDDGDENVEEDELEGDVPDQAEEHVSLLKDVVDWT